MRRFPLLLVIATLSASAGAAAALDELSPAAAELAAAELAAAEVARRDANAESRVWNTIFIHHSATEAGSVRSIDADHRSRRDAAGNPWRGIGYHFVIGNGRGMPDGRPEATFRWRQQTSGAHAGVRTHNEHGVGVCLIGNFESEPPTPAQLATLKALIASLRTTPGLSEAPVRPHRAVRKTACPGRLFPEELLTGVPTNPEHGVPPEAVVTARKESR